MRRISARTSRVALRSWAGLALVLVTGACGSASHGSSAGSGQSAGSGSTEEASGQGAGGSSGSSSTKGSGATNGSSGQSAPSTSGGSSGASGGQSGSGNSTASGSTVGGSGSSGATGTSSGAMTLPEVDGGLGPAQFAAGELDAPSNGGTITFEDIGAAGSYPSRRDPASGMCDAQNANGCCMTSYPVTGNQLTPWDQDLIMTLRGPLLLKQFAAYEPAAAGGPWDLVSSWDSRTPTSSTDIAFDQKFTGGVGSVCLVNASTSKTFPCGPGSVPYCTTGGADHYYGWSGSKLFVLLMTMPHQSTIQGATACQGMTNGWYDAPWIGLSLGELIREGAFSSCNCYSLPSNPSAGNGCGQINVFEVVNDNNTYQNFDVFSTNFFGYGGYVGQGPCGTACKASMLTADSDLINKTNSMDATMGGIATQGANGAAGTGPNVAFRRPESGYRYFIMLLDVDSRTVQLGIVHPSKIPSSIAPLLPDLPGSVDASTVASLLALRLPM